MITDPSRTILVFGMDYWPDSTGIAPYTTALADHMQQRGDSVTVAAGYPYYPQWSASPDYGRSLRHQETRNGVTIRRYRQYVPRTQSALRRLGFEASFLANATVSRPCSNPDAVVGIIPALADGLLAAATARWHGAPMILIVQDLMGSAAEQSGVSGGTRVSAATSRLEGWICRQATAIAVVASGFRDRLVTLGVTPERIHLVRNWTHISEPTVERQEVRARLGLPQDRFIALHAGNMGLKQGLDHLIDAATVAATQAPDLLFVLMGDGNQRDHLQRRAAGLANIRFLPPQDEDLFPSILAASDALLINQLPTVTDMSLPSKLTSYFSVGKPVVAAVARQSETAKVIEESGGGLLVDPTSSVDLVDALTSLAADPARAGAIGARGKSYATTHLSAEAALAQLETLIYGAQRGAATTMKGLSAA